MEPDVARQAHGLRRGRRRTLGPLLEHPEARVVGDGQHFGVAGGVPVGGGEADVGAVGGAQAHDLFRRAAVRAGEGAGNAVLTIEDKRRAEQGVGVQTAGEGGDGRLRTGGHDDAVGAALTPGVPLGHGVGTHEAVPVL